MLKSVKKFAVAITVSLTTACGGGGGSILVGGSGSGVGGTGIGSITGFSSVILNDDRIFTIDANTQLFIDDTAVSEAQLRTMGAGMLANFDVAADVDANFNSGTLIALHAGYNVSGPVTSLNPLQVLGHTIVVTGDTVLADIPGNDPANLNLNDIVEVSGFDNDSNIIQATRVQFVASGIPVWKMRGNVSNVVADTSFTMGTQQVNLNGVIPRDCGAGLTNNNVVEVKATPDPSFVAGNPLITVTDVECITLALNIPQNATANNIEAEIEGIVVGLISTSDFFVRQQRVITTITTTFEGGAEEDILEGARLEAEGLLDVTNGILIAEKIRFRQNRVRIEAPVTVPAGGLGASFTIMDVISVNTTALTEDDNGLVDGSGSAGNQQVEVRGFIDSNNQVFAELVRDRGIANPGDVRLRGPATDTCDPSAGDVELGILGVIVDTSDPGTTFLDSRQSSSISLPDNTALCGLVSIGTSVQAEDGTFSSTTAARIDNAAVIELED